MNLKNLSVLGALIFVTPVWAGNTEIASFTKAKSC